MKITGQWFEIDCRRKDSEDNWSVEKGRDDEIRSLKEARKEVKTLKGSDVSPKEYRILRIFEMSEIVETIP